MFAQSPLTRASQRLAASLRSPAVRTPLRRRFASAKRSDFYGAEDNAFNHERKAVKDHAAATSDLWRKLSIYATVPCLIIASVNAWVLWKQHWAHWSHMEPLEERTEYSYQNLRTKNFFWGNGDQTLFWNEKVNYHKKDE